MPGFSYDSRTKTAHFDIYVDGGKGRIRRRRTIRAPNAQEAKRLWAAFCDEINGRNAPPPDERAMTFRTFFERHFDEVCDELAPKTKHEYELTTERLLLPMFGDTPMNEIRPRDVNALAVKLKKDGLAAATVNGYVAVLIILLRKAVDHDFLDEFPLRKRVIRYKANKPENELSDDERRCFLAAFDDEQAFRAMTDARRSKGKVAASTRFDAPRSFGGGRNPESDATGAMFRRFQFTRTFFDIALETGLRLSDLRALTWRQIDFDQGFIFVVTKKTKTPTDVRLAVIAQSIGITSAWQQRSAVRRLVRAGVLTLDGTRGTVREPAPPTPQQRRLLRLLAIPFLPAALRELAALAVALTLAIAALLTLSLHASRHR